MAQPPPPPKKKDGGGFTVKELIDLALCSPEVGAVNFNILRMLLREIVVLTGIDDKPANVNDVEANQVAKFKNYVDGSPSGTTTPMPGVLKITPTSSAATPGTPSQSPLTPGSPSTTKATGTDGERKPKTPKVGLPPIADGRGHDHHGHDHELSDKVAKLEKHLEALYQLPTNNEILERAKGSSGHANAAMSVNDMWQIIQLNNRIAAAETAIQKMASLIEDLAKNMGKVKSDNKNIKKDAEDLQLKKSDLQIQGQELSEKCEKFADVVGQIQRDVDNLKRGWKRDRDNIEKALGTDLGKIPSFMKPKDRGPPGREGGSPQSQQPGPSGQPGQARPKSPGPGRPGQGPSRDSPRDGDTDGTPDDSQPGEQFERGTQTFVPAKDKDKGKPPAGPGKPSGRDRDPDQPGEQRRPGPKEDRARDDRPRQDQDQGDEPRHAKKGSPDDSGEPRQKHEKSGEPREGKRRDPERSDERPTTRGDPEQQSGEQRTSPQQQKQGGPSDGPRKSVGGKPGDGKGETSEPQSRRPDATSGQAQDEPGKPRKSVGIASGPGGPSQGGGGKDQDRPQSKPGRQSQGGKQDGGGGRDPTSTGGAPEDYSESIPSDEKQHTTSEERDQYGDDEYYGDEEPKPARGSQAAGAGARDRDRDLPKKTKSKHAPPQKQHHHHTGKGPDGKEEYSDSIPSEEPPPNSDYYEAPDDRYDDAQYEDQYDDGDTAPVQQESGRKSTTEKPKPGRRSTIPGTPGRLSEGQTKRLTPLDPSGGGGEEGMLPIEGEETSPQTTEENEITEETERRPHRSYDDEDGSGNQDEGVGTMSGGSKRKSGFRAERPKPVASRHRDKPKHHKHHHRDHDDRNHSPVDVVHGPIPPAGEPLPQVTMEGYLASLPPEEAANMAADAVQKELQKQYQHLQGMQRQLATDIQDKMEYIYQKLLKEIATQQMTTSPYMTVGGPEECLGPGICTGHGMPAGIAVCQFPEAKDKKPAGKVGVPDGKVCPGPGICPGSAVCPHCRADAKAQEALGHLKDPEKKSLVGHGTYTPGGGPLTLELDGALLQEMKSLVLLDLEKLRDEMRSKQVGAYDEQDILERLNAVWEALKILKYNEEALAVKIARQDAFFKKIPAKTIEKLHKIPEENLDALVTGNFQKPMYIPDDHRRSSTKDAEDVFRHSIPRAPAAVATGADKEDIQTLFNNLANVIAECTEQKERVDQLADTARILESGMVTKQMLLDALSDKADKGLINTKVSYDEFGTTIDELHTQLHNLMVEGYQRNENWKKVTSDLAEELAEKLDKVELAPIRAFFKNHLKTLEDKVKNLTNLVEEPDSSGTRKKLLRDYNCLSCDRMVNISGVTNGPLLPTIGPIPAGHSTASKRALDLHRMRMLKQLDPNAKNLNALERQTRGIKSRAGQKGGANPNEIANDMDVMPVVNRYTGGSHTAITNADLIAAQRRKSSHHSEAAPATPSAPAPTARRSTTEAVESQSQTAVAAPPSPPHVDASPSYEYIMNE